MLTFYLIVWIACVHLITIMNNVEESVLIPKEEYETLLEKASPPNGKHDMEVTDSKSKGEYVKNDDGDVDKSGVPSAPSSFDTAHPSPNPDTSKNDLVVEEQAESKSKGALSGSVSDSPNVSSPSKEEEEEVDPKVDPQEEKMTKSGTVETDSIKLLLEKVSPELKEAVKMLAGYISENGEGVIEWDANRRLIHLKELIPRTDVAKIMMYVLGKRQKPPKGATLFTRSLKSIGMSNPLKWIDSQSPEMVTPFNKMQSVVKKGDVKRALDNVDGVSTSEGVSKKKKSNSEGGKHRNKSKQLNGKWLSW